MKILKRAFTLTELLIALGVVAILCAVLMPVVNNMRPNQNTIMAKRAYYTVQSIVSELINDDACYPDKTASTTDMRVGFDDFFGYPSCRTTSEDTAEGTTSCSPTNNWAQDKLGWIGAKHVDSNCAGDTLKSGTFDKFTRLFIDRLGVLDKVHVHSLSASADSCAAGGTTCVFTTKDGMNWAFVRNATDMNFVTPAADSTDSDELAGGSIYVIVDVNGSREPNCGRVSNETIYSTTNAALGTGNSSACAERTSGFDRFRMRIRGNGQIEIAPLDEWAQEAVMIDKNITAD